MDPTLLALDEAHMRRCLALGRVALLAGEVPVDSLVARGAEILGEGLEGERGLLDPSAHAEVQAVRAACRKLRSIFRGAPSTPPWSRACSAPTWCGGRG